MMFLKILAGGLALFVALSQPVFARPTQIYYEPAGPGAGARYTAASPFGSARLAARDRAEQIWAKREWAKRGWAKQDLARAKPLMRRDPVWLAGQPEARGDDQWACLATAVYFEARGESVKGQFAVAEVILNRVGDDDFPKTVCDVVNQGSSRLNACQFSYACDGRPETIREREAFVQAGKIAKLMLDGAPRTLTQGATYFHSRHVRPTWARRFSRTATIGAHLFYREDARLALN